MTTQRIGLYGNFGRQNIGNDCTLQAVLTNLRDRLPDATFYSICTGPDEVSNAYGIPAVPIGKSWLAKPPTSGPRRRSKLLRLLRVAFVRVPAELLSLAHIQRSLKGTTMLLVVGTGVLEDESLRWALDILKWTVVARLRGVNVGFVSIGAGPLRSKSAQLIVKTMLRLAIYTSYRDLFSKTYMASVGLDTATHRIFPDLAFSLLPRDLPAAPRPAATIRVVGVGIIGYRNLSDFGTRGNGEGYRRYIGKTGELVAWLVKQGYQVRILIGDTLYDQQPLEDLKQLFQREGVALGPDRPVSDASISTLDDLLRELASLDLVIAPRYHNVVLGLLLGKPAIALSYHGKHNAVMGDFGLGDYCHDIADMDVDALKVQFAALAAQAEAHSFAIRETARQCRERLEEQYDLILASGAQVPRTAH